MNAFWVRRAGPSAKPAVRPVRPGQTDRQVRLQPGHARPPRPTSVLRDLNGLRLDGPRRNLRLALQGLASEERTRKAAESIRSASLDEPAAVLAKLGANPAE